MRVARAAGVRAGVRLRAAGVRAGVKFRLAAGVRAGVRLRAAGVRAGVRLRAAAGGVVGPGSARRTLLPDVGTGAGVAGAAIASLSACASGPRRITLERSIMIVRARRGG